ncbi:hypothetical protein H490_0108100 [Leucobacter sp. UCD-THU]|jgi:hypothetical protein|uniref:ABC transporter permease n=1 Tax=Leucobacter muris TaxID=1935379 RepID=A0ABX5QCK6_9MICO|nr:MULTISPECIES: hypothetical protein [Leucobacter]EYT54834.1 hypothetical protein H490_0108100 [Leucobacter sp. UCD-THU]QAB16681.1 hypothetical protein Leucomu_00875 [Leucobacter muris]
MNRVIKVTKLHLNKIGTYAVTPLMILAVVMVISIIIQLAIQRSTGVGPSSPEYAENARWNQAILWSLPGFLVYYGVQAIATTYPFGLALGVTRRNFILGTALANAVQAAYVAVLLLVLLGLELATNHWFMGLYVLDVYVTGSGDPVILGLAGFLGTLSCLTIGGLFGAVWVRFGPKGPAIMGLALGLVLAIGLLLLAPQLGEIVAGITGAWLALVAVLVMVVCLIGTWFAMRRASVR